MRNSIMGLVLGVIVLFVGMILMPIYYNACMDWRDDMNTAQTAARNFVDKVIDTRTVSEEALTDLNLALATTTCNFTYKYYRETKVVNPDTSGVSVTHTTWQAAEITDSTIWKTGDIITIEIEQSSVGLFQRFAQGFLGLGFNRRTVRLSGMVR